jgi:hypothetical protein
LILPNIASFSRVVLLIVFAFENITKKFRV